MTPEKVFAKYNEATNPSSIQKPKSLSMKMSMTQDSGVSPLERPVETNPVVRMHAFTLYCELPDKIHLESDAVLVAPGADRFLPERKIADIKLLQVFDGQSGWEVTSSPQDPSAGTKRELLFFEVDRLKGIVDSAFAMDDLDNISNAKYVGEQEVQLSDPTNGLSIKKTVHVVEALAKGGKKQTLYFDVKDGLLVKSELVDPLSNDKLTSVMTDYKQFGKVKLPSKIELTPTSTKNPSNTSIRLTLEELNFDTPAPPGAFTKPSI